MESVQGVGREGIGGAHLILDREHRDATIVIDGDCDLLMEVEVRPLLHRAIEADIEHLELDFRPGHFADLAALRLTHTADADLRSASASLTVKAPHAVRRLFELTGTAGRFKFGAC